LAARQKRSDLKPFFNYLTASRQELAKVTWPSRRQTIRLTLLVIGFSVVMAGILGTLDLIFSALLQHAIAK
jgi:preprotein translocase SecE subunit